MSKQQERMGERLRAERIRLGLGAEDFAQKLGIHRNSLSQYESGSRAPKTSLLMIMGELGMDLGFVLSGVRGDGSLGAEEQLLFDMFSQLSARERQGIMQLMMTLTGSTVDLTDLRRSSETIHDIRQPYRGEP